MMDAWEIWYSYPEVINKFYCIIRRYNVDLGEY